ncbi:MAG TPA: glycosyltransferase family 2 protein [Desulfohalobiaceae bacterium]|nr:glycosyltransferase family 2 protein [Desulfohalobiaceae bacterium]
MFRNDCLAIIPACNEAKTVGQVVKSVQNDQGIEALVVDDHSSDQTIREAKLAGAKVLPLASHMGTWTAIQTGFRYTLKHDYKLSITIDADGQHLTESIPVLLDNILFDQADLIIGSYPQRGSQLRHLAWFLFNKISRMNFQDITSGLKVYNQKAMELLLSPSAYLLDYQDVGTLILLQKKGIRISETSVKMQSRQDGHSRIFSNWGKVLRYMIITTILCLCKHDHRATNRVGTEKID